MFQPVLRMLLVLLLLLPFSSIIALTAAAFGPGDLDTTFDTDGKVLTNFGGYSDSGQSVAIQSDGKIVVGGVSYTTISTGTFALARYNIDGSLDTSFGTAGTGKVTTSFGINVSSVWSVAIYKTGPHVGKIVAAGDSTASGLNVFALARYNANGSLDTSFDTDGKVTTDFGSTTDYGYSVAIQSNDKIVVAGQFGDYPSADFALARYNTNGSLDNTGPGAFDTDGKLTTNFGGWDRGLSVAIQSDSKIVAAGHSQSGSLDFAVARYNANGSLDSSFDTDGKVTTDFGGGPDVGKSVAIQSDTNIVVAGSGGAAHTDFAVARYYPASVLPTPTPTPPPVPGVGWPGLLALAFGLAVLGLIAARRTARAKGST